MAPYSLFSQKKKKKKICGSGTTYTRASVGVVHKDQCDWESAGLGNRVNSLQKKQVKSRYKEGQGWGQSLVLSLKKSWSVH